MPQPCLRGYFILSVFLFLMAGCSPGNEEIEATVQVEVAKAFSATLMAEPVATAYPTATHYPIATTYPTATALATGTAYPTQEPYPTATAYPTPTPIPPEPTATATIAAATTAFNQPPPAPTSDLATILVQTMFDLRADIQSYSGTINAAINDVDPSTYCSELIQKYDALRAYPTFDVSTADQMLKDAYSKYRAAIERLNGVGGKSAEGTGSVELIENCHTFLNGGNQGELPAYNWIALAVPPKAQLAL